MCLLCLCVAQSRRVLLTPQLGFIASFIPQALFLLFFIDKWSVELGDETLLALIGGVTTFFAVSIACVWAYMRTHDVNVLSRRRAAIMDEPIYLSNTILAVLFVLNVIEIALWLYYVSRLVPGGTFVEKFAYIASVSKFGDLEDKIRFPFLLNQLKVFFDASGYMMVYLLIHSIILKNKKNRIFLILNIICWFISMLFSGNRGPFIMMFLENREAGHFIFDSRRSFASLALWCLFCARCIGRSVGSEEKPANPWSTIWEYILPPH